MAPCGYLSHQMYTIMREYVHTFKFEVKLILCLQWVTVIPYLSFSELFLPKRDDRYQTQRKTVISESRTVHN